MLGTHWPGGYAQYVYLPEEVVNRGFIEHIPDDMSYNHAALAETASAAIACQQYNNVGLNDTVVIIGDGPVGCLHVEIAKARGASKTIVVGLDKLALVPQFNPDYTFANTEPEKVVRNIREITDGLGADIVICAVPSVKPQQQALEMVRKRGRVVIYGGVAKKNEMTLINSNMIHYNELTVVGAFSYPSTGLENAIKLIHEKKISAEKYVTKTVSLDHVLEGMKCSEQGQALKVVIKPWE
jgi:L-iditol 2-dehydrogenase